MSSSSISSLSNIADVPITSERLKQTRAAADFEGLLIAQMFKSMRAEGSGWLGAGDDQSGEVAVGLGEEELSKALASTGGFGLAKLIQQGLEARQSHADTANLLSSPSTKGT